MTPSSFEFSRLPIVLALLLGLSASTAAEAEAAALSGTVTAGPSIEADKKLSAAADAWVCAPNGKIADPAWVVGEKRGLGNVVVTLDVPDAPTSASSEEVLIDQRGCVFTPHVSVVAPGQPVRVRNSDKVLHNFRTISRRNRGTNQAQVGGKENAFSFEAVEIIRAACDLHYWMSAVIVVRPHDFVAVTDGDGGFRIEGVEPGQYQAELWHERLGTKEATVTVTDEGGRLDLVWDAKDEKSAGRAQRPVQ